MKYILLSTIREYINSLPDKEFPVFYMEYVLSMQDKLIYEELKYLLNNNSLDIVSIDRLISDNLNELVNPNGKS